jgi:hypothetical protein
VALCAILTLSYPQIAMIARQSLRETGDTSAEVHSERYSPEKCVSERKKDRKRERKDTALNGSKSSGKV